MSAPGVVPFAVTNRTGKRNRAGRVPVVRPFIAAYHVAGCWLSEKTASMVALLACRGGVRTFGAACGCRASLACFIGTLAAVPGSVAMLGASPARVRKPLPCVSTDRFHDTRQSSPVVGGAVGDTASKACRALPEGRPPRPLGGVVTEPVLPLSMEDIGQPHQLFRAQRNRVALPISVSVLGDPQLFANLRLGEASGFARSDQAVHRTAFAVVFWMVCRVMA